MYKRSVGGRIKHWDFVLLDTVCLQISFIISYYIRFQSFFSYTTKSAYRTSALVLLLLGVFVATFFNTMHNVVRRGIWEEANNTVIQCGLVFATIVALLFTSKDSDHVSRIVLYVTVLLYAVLSFATRIIYKKILLSYKAKNITNRGMLVVGDRQGVEKALKAFERHPEEGISVIGLVLLGNETQTELNGIPIVATVSDAGRYIRNEWVDEVYFAVVDAALVPVELISQCNEMAVTIHQQMFTNEALVGNQIVEKIAKQPVLTTSINIPRARTLLIKRTVDIVAGLFLSCSAIILLLTAGIIIKIKSPGPVLLRHERIGINGKRFKMFTFRVMYMDAEKRMSDWKEKHNGEKLVLDTDPRFVGNINGKVGIGARLRRFGLDELPKGFNILLGSMSLVGTRAPSVEEWARYEYHHRARLACKPGLTGLWQASGRSKTMSFEEATAIDMEYIANWSLGLDWNIIFRTTTLKH